MKCRLFFIIVLFGILPSLGCASIGPKISQLPLGATTTEVEQLLNEGTYTVVERKNEPDGVVEVRRYRIKISYNYFDSRRWDLTFKDGKLIGWKYVGEVTSGSAGSQGKSQGMGLLCQDAIARGDRGGMMVHCN
jgi:hypothetical protein